MPGPLELVVSTHALPTISPPSNESSPHKRPSLPSGTRKPLMVHERPSSVPAAIAEMVAGGVGSSIGGSGDSPPVGGRSEATAACHSSSLTGWRPSANERIAALASMPDADIVNTRPDAASCHTISRHLL